MSSFNPSRRDAYIHNNAPFSNYNIYEFTKFDKNPSFDKSQKITNNVDYYDDGNATLALKGTGTSVTPLSIVFFSDRNMSIIQNQIKDQIKRIFNGRAVLTVDQDKDDLLIVMKSIFLQYARFLPYDLKGQIKELNRKTIKYIIPDMVTNIKQHLGYLKDLTTPIEPIPLPISTSTAGRKTLPSAFRF